MELFVLLAEKICLGRGLVVVVWKEREVGGETKSGLFVEYTVKDCYHPN